MINNITVNFTNAVQWQLSEAAAVNRELFTHFAADPLNSLKIAAVYLSSWDLQHFIQFNFLYIKLICSTIRNCDCCLSSRDT